MPPIAGPDVTAFTELRSALGEPLRRLVPEPESGFHLIEALRTLRMIHYSAWLARRWSDPAFPAAFPWFHTTKYWQDQILELREQVAAMQEPPLGPL